MPLQTIIKRNSCIEASFMHAEYRQDAALLPQNLKRSVISWFVMVSLRTREAILVLLILRLQRCRRIYVGTTYALPILVFALWFLDSWIVTTEEPGQVVEASSHEKKRVRLRNKTSSHSGIWKSCHVKSPQAAQKSHT
jgi:hypothetical protein